MILTNEQMKHLEVDGNETYRFTGHESATAEERQELKELDESSVDLYGFHMITNYKDL